jgi:uncharacterized peroxidase-related enzyme
MPASLEQIDWCDIPLVPPIPDPAWEAEFIKRFGRPTNFSPYLTPVRWMFIADEVMESRVTPNLSPNLEKMICLVVAMDNSCRYCYGAYRSVLKIMGYSEKLIRKLEESLAVNELSPQEKLALEFARKVTRSAPRASAADLKELKEAGFSRVQIAEIAYTVGNSSAGNRIATLLALPPAEVEKFDSSWIRKLLRPIVGRKFRDSLSKVELFEPDSPYKGPGLRIIQALSESPAGGALATVLSEAWKSPITSQRVKALIFAVVAKGLLCPACEAEAAALFHKEGWSDEEIDHLLSNLTSEKLEPFELKVLRFARETVRYQTRRIQTLAREFAKDLERDVVIEVVGLVALANGLARMSSVLQEC